MVALVSETGFNTMKGQLIRSIMFSPENSFKFYRDSLKYIMVLSILSVIGYIISLPSKIGLYNIFYFKEFYHESDMPFEDFIYDALDLITISVPPTLPTTL